MELTKFIGKIMGRTDLDSSLILKDSNYLLHISDTPSQFYPELKRIIKLINPKYIIHTGDLADNIKIELSPSLITKYKYEAKKLIDFLNSSNIEDIYITTGNHDDYNFINENKGKIKIFTTIGELIINNTKFVFSHYWNYLKHEKADIYLFGHDIVPKTRITESGIHLNGITSINIINLDTMEVTCVKYPFGTDFDRMRRYRIKI